MIDKELKEKKRSSIISSVRPDQAENLFPMSKIKFSSRMSFVELGEWVNRDHDHDHHAYGGSQHQTTRHVHQV